MHTEDLSRHIFNARCLMRQQHTGVLATQSLSIKGYPFGSVTPYWMTEEGEIILYASDIAQHSRNMKADPKVSLCVFAPDKADSQANARVTILGDATVLGPECAEAEHYYRLYPQALGYKNAHDFQFYRIVPTRIRYIGGFGEIYWFKAEDWRYPTPAWLSQREGMISHMHDDHLDALALMLNHQYGLTAETGEVRMLSAVAEGFHVIYQQQVYFITYETPCLSEQSVRPAMVKLTHAARRNVATASVA